MRDGCSVSVASNRHFNVSVSCIRSIDVSPTGSINHSDVSEASISYQSDVSATSSINHSDVSVASTRRYNVTLLLL